MKKITAILLSFTFLLLFNLTIIPSALAASMSLDMIEIRQLLEQFVAGCNQHDANILEDIWNLDYNRTTYIPVESEDIIQGGKNITKYYQDAISYVASVKLGEIFPCWEAWNIKERIA